MNRSDEDIIPKWVIRKFKLLNEYLTLQNQTEFPYRSLKVPACRKCNNEDLSRIESLVETAISGGFEKCIQVPDFVLYHWAAKIFFGILYKETHLPNDRREKNSKPIFSPEFMRRYDAIRFYLQAVRGNHFKKPICPGSVFLFRTMQPSRVESRWDLMDSIAGSFISIRMGEVGLIVDLLDLGVHREIAVGSFVDKVREQALDPEQYRELTAMMVCGSHNIHFSATIAFEELAFDEAGVVRWETESVPVKVTQYSIEELAPYIAFYRQVPLEQVLVEKGAYRSLLFDESGGLQHGSCQ